MEVLSWSIKITPTVRRFIHVETYHNLTRCLQANPTKRTLALSSRQIFARKLLSTPPRGTAVCNLASLALSTFISNGKYDSQKLHDVTKVVAYNLNRIIHVNYYPIPEARLSNTHHHIIGVGVQGLADTFMAVRMPFDSPTAKELNIQIFETICHGALEARSEIAERDGPYETWIGSPAQLGQLQYDL